MKSKLKVEINELQIRATQGYVSECIMIKLLSFIQVASYLMGKGEIHKAEAWMQGALEYDPDVIISEDLKGCDGNDKDIQAWLENRLKGDSAMFEVLPQIREQYHEIEKLRTA